MSLCEMMKTPYFIVCQWPMAEIKRWMIKSTHDHKEREREKSKGK